MNTNKHMDKKIRKSDLEKVMDWYHGNSTASSWALMKKYPLAWKELLRTL